MSNNLFFEQKGPFPLNEIIKLIGAEDKKLNNNIQINDFKSLDAATNKDMTFLNSSKYQSSSIKTKAAACITTSSLFKFLPDTCIKLSVKNVLFAVTKASSIFFRFKRILDSFHPTEAIFGFNVFAFSR